MFAGKRRNRIANFWAILTSVIFVLGILAFSLNGFFGAPAPPKGDQQPNPDLGLPSNAEWSEIYDVTIVPQGTSSRIVVGTHKGFKYSDNLGQTWVDGAESTQDADVMAVEAVATPPTIYAGGANFQGVVRSPDGGSTWYQSLEGLPKDKAWLIAITAWTRDNVDNPGPADIDLIAWGPEAGLFTSHDGGATWTEFPKQLADVYIYELLYVPGQPSTLYAATEKGLYRSMLADGGDWGDWVTVPGLDGQTVTTIARDPGGDRLFVGTPEELLVSTDSGSTWNAFEPLSTGTLSLAFDLVNPQLVVLVTVDGQVLRSQDGGDHWEPIH